MSNANAKTGQEALESYQKRLDEELVRSEKAQKAIETLKLNALADFGCKSMEQRTDSIGAINDITVEYAEQCRAEPNKEELEATLLKIFAIREKALKQMLLGDNSENDPAS